MNSTLRKSIKSLISSKINDKLKNYTAETEYSPFFSAIFKPEIIIQASIMQSLYTSFGMSIYEQMAVLLALNAGHEAIRQYDLEGSIDQATTLLISEMCENPRWQPNKRIEIEKIRRTIKQAPAQKDPEGRVDVFIKRADGSELYVDITTVKPNLKEFRALRRKMLKWAALRLSQNPKANIKTCIGIPYNPYFPNPYCRWTGTGCDSKEDILVQNDLWYEFAGYDVFPNLIDLFMEVGAELKHRINNFTNNRV